VTRLRVGQKLTRSARDLADQADDERPAGEGEHALTLQELRARFVGCGRVERSSRQTIPEADFVTDEQRCVLAPS
jgi:hypothetical protein